MSAALSPDAMYLAAAVRAAKQGLSEGGIPIGAALVVDGGVLATGWNKRVQLGSAIRHGETDCLENAGRLPATVYARSTMVTTLSPCDMCTGAILLYKIPRVVIGENRTFYGGEDLLRSRGVEVVVLDDDECTPDDDRVHLRPAVAVERGHRRPGLTAASGRTTGNPFSRPGSRARDCDIRGHRRSARRPPSSARCAAAWAAIWSGHARRSTTVWPRVYPWPSSTRTPSRSVPSPSGSAIAQHGAGVADAGRVRTLGPGDDQRTGQLAGRIQSGPQHRRVGQVDLHLFEHVQAVHGDRDVQVPGGGQGDRGGLRVVEDVELRDGRDVARSTPIHP